MSLFSNHSYINQGYSDQQKTNVCGGGIKLMSKSAFLIFIMILETKFGELQSLLYWCEMDRNPIYWTLAQTKLRKRCWLRWNLHS